MTCRRRVADRRRASAQSARTTEGDSRTRDVTRLELGPDLPRSTLTHHTSLLRESGVVHVRAQGRKCLISLRTEDLESRFPGLLGAVLDGYERTTDLTDPHP